MDRIEAIIRCCDAMDEIKRKYPPNALLQSIGQLDWLDELHELVHNPLYEFVPQSNAGDITYEMVTKFAAQFEPKYGGIRR